MLLNTVIDEDCQVQYVFQPRRLNEETGQPVDHMLISPSRIIDGVEYEQELPMKVLGTEVEDTATGFKGMALHFVLHLNGCVHVNVKPSTRRKNGEPVDAKELDIRRLRGDAIPVMTTTEKKESQKRTPSPTSSCIMSTKY
jgi:hypothetical protein